MKKMTRKMESKGLREKRQTSRLRSEGVQDWRKRSRRETIMFPLRRDSTRKERRRRKKG